MNSREQFEEWECNAPEGPQTDPMWLMRCGVEPDKYGIVQVQHNWEVWQASRSDIRVKLPGIYADCYCPSTAQAYKEDCASILTAIGLTVEE